MKFYNVKDSYIQFLRGYDSKVATNKREHRPYVGIVLEVESIKYYAPFTSPKPKHYKMKNGKDFRKIHDGKYGAINFNNMIPVPDKALVLLDIDNEPDEQYRRLLQNQYKEIKKDATIIYKTARNLRNLLLRDESELTVFDKNIKARCCNLRLLESVYEQYEKNAKESACGEIPQAF